MMNPTDPLRNHGETMRAEEQSPSFAEPLLPSDGRAAQLFRTLEYQSQALRETNPRNSCLKSINCGLIRTALAMQDAVEEELATGPITVDRFQQLRPTLDAQVRLARQIVQFAQLEERLGREGP